MTRIGSVILVFATSLLAGCGSDEPETKTLTLFVAASLTDVIEELSAEFMREYGVEVVCNFASSGALAQQLLASPRADLYLSASQRWMDAVSEGGRLEMGTRRTLLSNRLAVVAHKNTTWESGDPAKLAEQPFEFLAIGDPDSVPAGQYAATWLESVKIDGGKTLWAEMRGRISPAPDVRAVLAQVEGSVDVVGIVYRTDYLASDGKVRLIYEVPPQSGPAIEYPVAILTETKEPELAAEFLNFLSGPRARKLFEKHGFIVAK